MFERIDFQTPRKPDESSNRILNRWQSEICSIVKERWETLIPNEISISPHSIRPSTERSVIPNLPVDGYGAHLKIGSNQIPSLLVMSGRLSRTLVESVLSIQGEDWPASQNMSAGERAILEILFENLNDAIQESWSGKEPIQFQMEALITKPNRTRIFATGAEFILFKFQISTIYGEEEILWLTPKHELEELVDIQFDISTRSVADSTRQIAELTERIPAEVTVHLGMSELKMSEAIHLSKGDVLLLDQSIHKPLTAFVSDCPKWKVNPVAIGTRVGFEVVSLIEE